MCCLSSVHYLRPKNSSVFPRFVNVCCFLFRKQSLILAIERNEVYVGRSNWNDGFAKSFPLKTKINSQEQNKSWQEKVTTKTEQTAVYSLWSNYNAKKMIAKTLHTISLSSKGHTGGFRTGAGCAGSVWKTRAVSLREVEPLRWKQLWLRSEDNLLHLQRLVVFCRDSLVLSFRCPQKRNLLDQKPLKHLISGCTMPLCCTVSTWFCGDFRSLLCFIYVVLCIQTGSDYAWTEALTVTKSFT